jgi:hypothetical protein
MPSTRTSSSGKRKTAVREAQVGQKKQGTGKRGAEPAKRGKRGAKQAKRRRQEGADEQQIFAAFTRELELGAERARERAEEEMDGMEGLTNELAHVFEVVQVSRVAMHIELITYMAWLSWQVSLVSTRDPASLRTHTTRSRTRP